ncbi:MAG: phage tail tape measure protein [Eubacteriales bacterium]|jgi:TP901 family phage tail tape measure protein
MSTVGGLELAPLKTKITVDLQGWRSQLEQAKAIARTSTTQMQKDLQKLANTGKELDKIGGKMTRNLTVPIIGAGVAASKFAIDFESAFAGVRKTVDASEAEYAALSKGIRNMAKELPTSAVAIAGVAEAAGQLGIENKNILSFTRTMIDLGESTNLSSEEAATSLARFANITQMSQRDFDRLGSTIVALGNNFATTESEIVAMGMRLAGAGRQIGMSEAQTMALAAALSSVGIEAEAGGTAMSKVMSNMQLAVETGSKDLQNFAAVAGMSAEDFKLAFERDAAGALIAFIEGLGKTEEQGISAIKVLEDMGISEVRMRDALLRAAGASDVFTGALEMGSKAWTENTALTKEAEQRYATTASQMKIAWNYVKEAGMVVGEVLVPYIRKGAEYVKSLADKFSQLNPETQKTIMMMLGLTAAAGPLLKIAGKGITAYAKVAPVLKGIGSGLVALKTGTTLVASAAPSASAQVTALMLGTAKLGTTTAAAGAATTGLSASLAAGAVAAAPFVAALAAVGVAGYQVYKHLSEDAVPAVDLFADKVEGVAGAYDEMGNAMYTTTVEISDATKQAVGAYMDLDRDVQYALFDLYTNATILTQEIANDMINKTDNMTTQVIAGYEKQKDAALALTQEKFTELGIFTTEEQMKILEQEAAYYDQQSASMEAAKSEINAIYQRAADERRAITLDEQNQINALRDQMKQHAVQALSEQETEAKVILERLKADSTRVTAEMVSENVQKLNEQRDKAVQAAEAEYDETIRWAIDMKDNKGKLSQEQYDIVVAKAAQQRDDVIKAAEDTRTSAVNSMVRMNSELETQVDMSTGRIKNKWQQLMDKWDSWVPNVKVFDGNVSLKYQKEPVHYNAAGGLITKPIVSWVGEGGEPEAIIPLSKFPAIMADILSRTGNSYNTSNKEATFNNNIVIEGGADNLEIDRRLRQLMREEARLING